MLPPPTRTQGVARLLTELNSTRLSLFGEEVSAERRARLLGQVAEYLLVSLIVFVIAGIEVGRWYFNTPPQPVWVCVFAAGIIGYAAVRVWFILPQLRTLGRERNARRMLRQSIDSLCAKGFILFEGLRGLRGSPVGPVIAGPSGLFCLVSRFMPRGRDLQETLTHSDNETLTVGNHPVLADPLGQAQRAAKALYELLAENGLDTIPVQPVVIFPGWTVTRPEKFPDPDVLVVGDQGLEAAIRGTPVELEAKDLIAVSLFLEKAVRAGAD